MIADAGTTVLQTTPLCPSEIRFRLFSHECTVPLNIAPINTHYRLTFTRRYWIIMLKPNREIFRAIHYRQLNSWRKRTHVHDSCKESITTTADQVGMGH
jgi:hypothetical protein